jgi:hypothetical protein
MDRVEASPVQGTRCSRCGKITPNYDTINCGSIEEGYRPLCGQCFNGEAAKLDGLDFEHLNFEPVRLADYSGQAHEFHFRTRLFGPGVALDAFELRDGSPAGYQFQIIGDPEEDLLALLGRLIDRMRRALSVRHVQDTEYGMQVADKVVRARIEWDEAEDGGVPLIIVDGRELAWDEFGRMLMTFEGWQFKLEIRDKSEELA